MPTKDRIRLRREALFLTQTDVAEQLGRLEPALFANWDFSTVSKIERGVRRVSADEIPYFAMVLKCSPLDLLDTPVE